MYSTRPVPAAIAHRGLHHHAPENSIPAFRAALEAGAEGIELDVHATSDGQIYVHHDAVPKAVDRSGILASRPFAKVTSEYVAQLEVSPGVAIPRLDDAIEEIATRGELYIEIKAKNAEHAVAQCLRRHDRAISRCAIHSFDHRIARRMVGLIPSLRVGVLQVSYPIDSPAVLRSSGASDLWQHTDFIDAALVADVASCGGRVIAWTSNDSAQWESLKELGVAAICTDRVDDYVRSVREERAGHGQPEKS
ncbi:MAG: glycerophosphodiester phosphodiesterase [Gemmatimonadaceae bacterium]|nr:glycerophosphodiester phosphodiesterase [Gemmatimonadaceae bacterium]MDQ3244321.1 glycerophosphodiester phosphodiesterase [Gemmatimonadota bacterium]